MLAVLRLVMLPLCIVVTGPLSFCSTRTARLLPPSVLFMIERHPVVSSIQLQLFESLILLFVSLFVFLCRYV